jgi:hypothetical protein
LYPYNGILPVLFFGLFFMKVSEKKILRMPTGLSFAWLKKAYIQALIPIPKSIMITVVELTEIIKGTEKSTIFKTIAINCKKVAFPITVVSENDRFGTK